MTTVIHEPAFTAEDSARLSKTDLTRCRLVMNIGPHEIAYGLVDPESRTFLSVKGYFFDAGTHEHSLIQTLEQYFDQNRVLFTAFRDIRISFDSPAFTLVPEKMFDAAFKRDYLSALYPEAPRSVVLYDMLGAAGAVNVFAAGRDVAGYLKKEFPSARFSHAQSAFLEAVLLDSPRSGSQAYVRALAGSIILTVVDSGQVVLMQNYPISHGSDALYYTANALSQLELSGDGAEVYLSGEIPPDAPLYQAMAQEIPSLSWLERPASLSYVAAFGEYPPHYFYTLGALAL
jgi:hypothetical protein